MPRFLGHRKPSGQSNKQKLSILYPLIHPIPFYPSYIFLSSLYLAFIPTLSCPFYTFIPILYLPNQPIPSYLSYYFLSILYFPFHPILSMLYCTSNPLYLHNLPINSNIFFALLSNLISSSPPNTTISMICEQIFSIFIKICSSKLTH